MPPPDTLPFADLAALAEHLRQELQKKKFVLLYAHNGTGKTWLSTEFKNRGKIGDKRDTLYFNAFTEDLFSWDNDLVEDLQPRMLVNPYSNLISAFGDLEFGDQIEDYFSLYFSSKFEITRYSAEEVAAMADSTSPLHNLYRRYGSEMEIRPKHIRFKSHDNDDWIKISRGEERIFIWSVFLAIIQQALGGTAAYRGIKYLYIDDPVCSLDEHNVIKVAHDLTNLLSKSGENLRIVISTHHVLFYNVVANQLRKRASKYFLTKAETSAYRLENWDEVPPLHHLSTLLDLCRVRDSGQLNHHHFNMLRRVLEQTAAFLAMNHGLSV